MPFILLISTFMFFNGPSEKFKKLLCNFSFEQLSVELTKKELRAGFKRIDKVDCIKELIPVSFWFVIIRDNKSTKPVIIKYEDRKEIPGLLSKIEKGDVINFTILISKDYLRRVDKVIRVI
ncbi:hypothetical protein [Lewinella sp. LCG006]|uniref:hypothetical protein n=1 Tax=Lewinella sp. LCG006 TaxID=3231911 RepID=UPI003460BB13